MLQHQRGVRLHALPGSDLDLQVVGRRVPLRLAPLHHEGVGATQLDLHPIERVGETVQAQHDGIAGADGDRGLEHHLHLSGSALAM